MTNHKVAPDTPNETDRTLPKTGNTTNIAILTLELALSVGAMGILYYRKKKAKTK